MSKKNFLIVAMPNLEDICHMETDELLYDPENKIFRCEKCKAIIDGLTPKKITQMWVSLWLITAESNRDANLECLRQDTPESLELMQQLNSILSDIERQMIIYIDDVRCRYALINVPDLNNIESVEESIDAILDWIRKTAKIIMDWCEK